MILIATTKESWQYTYSKNPDKEPQNIDQKKIQKRAAMKYIKLKAKGLPLAKAGP